MTPKIHTKPLLWSPRLLAACMLLLFFVSLFITLLSPFHVRAQASPPKSPADIAKIYEATAYFGHCMQAHGLVKIRSLDDLNKGAIIDKPFGTVGNGEEYGIGYLASPENGKQKCLDDGHQRGMLAMIGIGGEELFSKSGVYKVLANAGGYEVESGSRRDLANKLISYVGQKYSIDMVGNLPHSSQFFNLQAAFKKECDGLRPSSGGIDVHFIDDQGNLTVEKRLLTDPNKSVSVGFGMDGTNKEELSCSDIVKKMDDFDDETVKAMKDFIAKGGNQNSNTGNGGVATPTCESINNNVLLSWILCGVVNAIDDSINKIKDSVDGLLDVNKEEYDNPSIKAIWSYFKNLASFLLVGVALIVIIGQALNRE